MRVEDLADVIMGQSPPGDSCNVAGLGMPLLNGPTEFGVYHPTPAQWTSTPLKVAEQGDVLFCVRGSTTGRMNSADRTYAIGRGIAAIRPRRRSDERFMLFALQFALAALLTQVTGSVFPNLSYKQIATLRIACPEESSSRKAIAEVLGALDDKIAANANLVKSCDTLSTWRFAQMLTQHETCRLSDLALFVNGHNYTANATGSGRMVIRIAEINGGAGRNTVHNDVEAPNDNVAKPGDLLFSWSGSLHVKRWSLTEGIINQHIFKVIPKSNTPMWLVYQALLGQLPSFRATAAGKATTMGHIQRHHLDVTVPVPTPQKIAESSALMTGLWDRALAAEQESQTLASLRDTLLPALMSGKLRIRDAEKTAEEVL